MRFIGITGGVGAGKSEILGFMENNYNCRVMLADNIAHELMAPGRECYMAIKETFPNDDIYEAGDGSCFDKLKLARFIFSDAEKRDMVNSIVHPAVKSYVLDQIKVERAAGKLDILVLESALLIDDHYDEICDEMWYIFTSEDNRRARLKASRGYSDQKVDNIFASQLSEQTFRKYCRKVIDNNGSKEESFEQIEQFLAEYGIMKN